MKFPKFGRRKSVGNALDAGYEPANTRPEPEPQSRASFSSSTLFAFSKTRVNSGNESLGSSNRLSSSSTLPSADLPRTPSSSDDFRRQHHHHHLFGGHHDSSSRYTPSSNSSQSRPSGRSFSPPRRKTMATTTAPPRLDTDLGDSTPLFGDDLFSFTTESVADPPAPKLASSRPIRTDSPDSYDSIHFPTDGQRKKTAGAGGLGTSLDPRRQTLNKSLDAPLPALPTQQQSQINRLPVPEHRLVNKLSFEDSPSEQSLFAPQEQRDSPRNSRNLTPAAPTAKPIRHAREDSLNAPVVQRRAGGGGGGKRQSSGDSAGLRRSSAMMQRRSSTVEDEDANIVRRSIKRELQPQRPGGGLNVNFGSTSTNSSMNLSPGAKDRDSGWEGDAASGNSSVGSFRHERSTERERNERPAALRAIEGQGKKHVPSKPTTPQLPSPMDDDDDDNLFDTTLTASAALANQYSEKVETSSKTAAPKKVMTGAEFERYQRQKAAEADSESESEAEADLDDESDKEQRMKMAKQRQKQEAHLSVFRQQVRKVTGSTGELPPFAGQPARINSAPLLSTMGSQQQQQQQVPTFSVTQSRDVSDDDEDVPLGILQAHGFPNKARPPSRLQPSTSQPNLRASAQGPLPPFARNLPADPYFGAGLVNQPARMSLAYGIGSDARSTTGGSVYGNAQPSQAEIQAAMARPGGLIGEIMLAEEQKAARKGLTATGGSRSPYRSGSPAIADGNTGVGVLGMGAGYPVQQSQRPVSHMPGMGMGMGMGMGGMGAGGAASSTAELQLQMQMMQMQLEMARMQAQLARSQQQAAPVAAPPHQQMMLQPNPHSAYASSRTMSLSDPLLNRPMSTYAQSIRSMAPPPPPQTALSSNGAVGGLRPVSNLPPHLAYLQQHQQHRMSLLPTGAGTPQLQPQIPLPPPLINQAYTPSLAPSERSTIGQPQRYRPVSHMGGSGSARSGTFTSTSLGAAQRLAQGGSGLRNRADEEEREEEWGDVEKKKKEKVEGWRRRKLGGLLGRKEEEK